MKNVLKSLAAVGILGLAANASAALITVSNVSFSDLAGNNEQFKWSVSAVSSLPIQINLSGAGDVEEFTYGRLNVLSFDATDEDDSFRASFLLTPPGTSVVDTGSPDAGFAFIFPYVEVIFNDSWHDVAFGNGGLYQYKFSDAPGAISDTFDLKAQLKLVRESSGGAVSVPEPTSLALLGAGLIALGLARRRAR